jgi:hypothetical protein
VEQKQRHALVTRLWMDMDAMFGSRFDEGGGPGGPKFNIWLEAMADYTVQQVRDGVLAARKWKDPWPPTLPEFRNLCRPFHRSGEQPASEALPPRAALVDGRLKIEGNRIVDINGAYQHQVKVNGEWVNSDELEIVPAQELV